MLVCERDIDERKINARIIRLDNYFCEKKLELPSYLGSLESLLSKNSEDFTPINISTLLNRMGRNSADIMKEKGRAHKLIDSLETIIKKNSENFLPRNISNSFNGMSNLGYYGISWHSLENILTGSMYNTKERFNAKDLAQLANASANAYSRVGRYNPAVFNFIANQIRKKSYDPRIGFNSQDISNIVNAFSRVGRYDKVVFDFAADFIEKTRADLIGKKRYDTAKGFTSTSIANIVNAFANAYSNVGRYDKVVFDFAADLIEKKIYNPKIRFNSQDISNIVNAFSRVGRYDKVVFDFAADFVEKVRADLINKKGDDLIEKKIYDTARRVTPQELSNIVNAFANAYSSVGRYDKVVFDFAADLIEKRLYDTTKSFTPWDISNIVNAFSRVGRYDRVVFDFAADFVEKKRAGLIGKKRYDATEIFNLHDISNMVNAFANAYSGVGRYDKVIFDFAADRIEKMIRDPKIGFNARDKSNRVNAQDLANIANAYVKVRRDDKPVFDFITKQIRDNRCNANIKFKPQDLSNLAHAYGKIGRDDEDVFGFINDQIEKEGYGTSESFTPQQLANLVYGFGLVYKDIPKKIQDWVSACEDFKPIELNQLYMGFSLLGVEVPDNIKEQYKKKKHGLPKEQSPYEKEVFDYISNEFKLDVSHNELLNGFEMDIVLPEKNLNIEIDGYSHLIYADQQRDKYLKKQGWEVIRIPVSDVSNQAYKKTLASLLV
ncbi:DUF559 domain-containing protein [Candidatus Woesearchaeota archaeon]|nr:DUF559 domain-containing protein [Candidatus Woesearchaeota archaeon]